MNNKEDLIQIINQKLSEKIRKLESMIFGNPGFQQ